MAGSSGRAKEPVSAGPGQRSVVFVVAAVIALSAVQLPVSGRPFPPMPGVVAVRDVALLVTELSTGFLLLVRFRAVRTWSLLVLGAAYFYSGLMSILHLLTRPATVMADRALVEVPPHLFSWIFVLWINGFALASLIAVILEARSNGRRRVAAENVDRAVALGLGVAVLAVLAAFVAVLAAADLLPPLRSGQGLTELGATMTWPCAVFLGASIALILLVIGEQNWLFLWLSLALLPMMFAAALTVTSIERYTIGWTIARVGWLASACVLFVYLLVLHARDQHLWTRARELLSVGAEDEVVLVAETISVALQAFVARENVARYRNMLEDVHDEAQRQILLRMLADEESRARQLGKSTTNNPST